MSTITVALPSQAAWNSKPPYVKLQAYESDRSPGIEAKFSLDKYLLREAMLAAKTRTKPSLPHVFPQQIDSPAVWSPSTLDLHAITYHVSSKDKEELETALERFKESKGHLNTIAPESFLLPSLGPRLRELSRDIHEGKGAVIIRGLQPAKYSLQDNIVLFAGLSSHIGDQRGRQSAQNDVLTHLYSSHDKSIIDPRPGLSNHGLPFHNDHCDVLALYVQETAQTGGTTRWSSFGQMYNEIAKTKPEVIEVLARNDWPHETPQKSTKNLPLMFIDDHGLPFLSFTRFALTGLPTYPRNPNSPKLTPEQSDALDTLEFMAAKNAVEVPQEKGDIFLINNRNVLHARDRIRDVAGDSRRHLMRLCLRDTEYGRPIPSDLMRRWGDIFDKNQHKDGKWMLGKENSALFVSNNKFDSAFTNDEVCLSHG